MNEREQDLLHLLQEQQGIIADMNGTIRVLTDAVIDLEKRVRGLQSHVHTSYTNSIGGQPAYAGATGYPEYPSVNQEGEED